MVMPERYDVRERGRTDATRGIQDDVRERGDNVRKGG